jgi:hypothetical protein
MNYVSPHVPCNSFPNVLISRGIVVGIKRQGSRAHTSGSKWIPINRSFTLPNVEVSDKQLKKNHTTA